METRLKQDEIPDRDGTLAEIQNRVLWIAMQMVDYANNVRPNPDGVKVGGHQSSSASVVTIMTALYFDFMKERDRISVKPHASPVYHAIQFLLGNLDPEYLKQMRGFHGLQAYPSRTKDPDYVDFSTGSVGLGAVAPNFASLTGEYTRTHGFHKDSGRGRYISVVGDAELDEGSVWEAIAEPEMSDLSNILWVVDLNRQSLDRIIPGIRARAWREMFDANGWSVIDAKYGKHLQTAFKEPHGDILRDAIDDMSNQVYQRLLRVSPSELREWLPRSSRYSDDLSRFLERWDDHQLQDLFRNLGGHDFSSLRQALNQADASVRPSVIFAYTLKGWRLPSAGDPQNHSVTLSAGQMRELRNSLGITEEDAWSGCDPDSPSGFLCRDTSQNLSHKTVDSIRNNERSFSIPRDFGRIYRGDMSTQQIFGLVLTDISRNLPELSERVVTVSPDVASSTNLGGWINRVGVWAREDKEELPDEEVARALKWEELYDGQHIELGISENNLFMMLGQLGLSYEQEGELLFPIGTLYDPFIRRGLDAFVYSVYSGAKFIVIGTPSGLTLSTEGGAHQSLMTPSIGVEMPDLDFYEPCFGQELEWIMLSGLEQIRNRTRSTYLRLTSRRMDQGLLTVPEDPEARELLRKQVLRGVYPIKDMSTNSDYCPGANVVNIFVSGAMVPEACQASEDLAAEGIFANVLNVTGPGPLYRYYQEAVRSAIRTGAPIKNVLSELVPIASSDIPAITVVDGHPHSLSWIGSALRTVAIPLGATDFGQSGSRRELYVEYGIDADTISAACFSALEK